jgi:diguanylate cyclase (GGDEF)-like protein
MSLWSISKPSFLQIAGQNPGFSLKILSLLSARLRQSDEQFKQLVDHGKQRDEALESLVEQVMRDPLTGLYNRRALEITLSQKISQTGQSGPEVGILMLDVDHFKRVNDTFGHPAGDAVLKELASLLARSVREEDVVCRYGGEEFVVVMPRAPIGTIQDRAEQIRIKFQETRVNYQGEVIAATLSIGAAIFPAHGSSGEAVLACADQALYQAKHSGRNRVVIWQAEDASNEPDTGRPIL